jgi:CelD/BcsL family acetyltransferase involved in cellulose biosynthesis
MATARLVRIESVSELRAAARQWDELWLRSEVVLPIARAELIAQWIEAAAPKARFNALVVEHDSQFVAAIPLVTGRIKRLLKVAQLPSNDWSWAGDLLLDPSADDRALELVADALGQQPIRLLWLDGVAIESPRWMRLMAAFDAVGLEYVAREQFHVGQIEIDHDWSAYRASWSANHRHQMRRMEKRAAKETDIRLVVIRDAQLDQIETLLRRGFEVESRSWKGSRGTAVLSSPEVFGYYCRQARQLAEWNQLQLTYLQLADRPFAFEYGWNAKGVYCSPKVGYDEEFRQFTPGQLLRLKLLEGFFTESDQRLFDFVGPLAEATSKWATRSYPIGRLVVATKRRSGRTAVRFLHRWWSHQTQHAQLRRRSRQESPQSELVSADAEPTLSV